MPQVRGTIDRYEEVLKDLEDVYASLKLDYEKVRDFARKSQVTILLEEKISKMLGYPPH